MTTNTSAPEGPAISSKLLGTLALSILVALVGAWRLLSGDPPGDVGFDGVDSLPAAVSGPAPDVEPAPDVPLSRNPFLRSVTAPDTFTPTEPSTAPTGTTDTTVDTTPRVEETPNDPSPVESATSGGAAPPAFPLPDLVGQDPPDRADRDDFTG